MTETTPSGTVAETEDQRIARLVDAQVTARLAAATTPDAPVVDVDQAVAEVFTPGEIVAVRGTDKYAIYVGEDVDGTPLLCDLPNSARAHAAGIEKL